MEREYPKEKWSFFRFIIFLIKKIKDDDVFMLASQLAYSLIVAFFPFLIFLMTLVGRSTLSSDSVLAYLNSILPTSAYDLVKSTVVEVLEGKGSGLLPASLLFAIWSASRGIAAVIRGLNKAYDQDERRGYFKLVIISIFSTIAFALAILAALFFFVLGDVFKKILMQYLPFDDFMLLLWQFLRFALIIFFITLTFAALYHFAPSKKLGWMEVLPGAVTASLGWLITSLGFSFYVNNFANYSRLYGSLGAIIILLTWLYLSSVILLIGGEINALLVKKKSVI
ncbi:YihY/virulence factor BrkB family protein [Clostridium polynesiense]|uniref:YihY/virulence factor BrkB family protein n=1 Tax=Clostridium polynesiense TaxID=1325933 RepID=UPI00058D40A0|nr:YihY/virulence factor BrkB family protein [Clostridium polynesiense]